MNSTATVVVTHVYSQQTLAEGMVLVAVIFVAVGFLIARLVMRRPARARKGGAGPYGVACTVERASAGGLDATGVVHFVADHERVHGGGPPPPPPEAVEAEGGG